MKCFFLRPVQKQSHASLKYTQHKKASLMQMSVCSQRRIEIFVAAINSSERPSHHPPDPLSAKPFTKGLIQHFPFSSILNSHIRMEIVVTQHSARLHLYQWEKSLKFKMTSFPLQAKSAIQTQKNPLPFLKLHHYSWSKTARTAEDARVRRPSSQRHDRPRSHALVRCNWTWRLTPLSQLVAIVI